MDFTNNVELPASITKTFYDEKYMYYVFSYFNSIIGVTRNVIKS